MIEKIKKYAKENKVPIIMDDSFDYINNYVKENKVNSVLEIGSAIGYFACAIAIDNPEVEIVTIEKDDKMYNIAVQNVNACKLDGRIEVKKGDALEVNIKSKFDLIFIDAAMGQYIDLFQKYKENLNDGGVIFCDNMNFHGYVFIIDEIESKNLRGLAIKTKRFREFLENNKEFDSEILEIGDGISVSRRNKDEVISSS